VSKIKIGQNFEKKSETSFILMAVRRIGCASKIERNKMGAGQFKNKSRMNYFENRRSSDS
jgi:hypothetical protein